MGECINTIDLGRVFENVDIESEYLEGLLIKILEIISRSIDLEDLSLGPVKEGPTSSGEIAEVTKDGSIVINSEELQKLDQPAAMAVIAHEISHNYLEHYLDAASDDGGLRNERDADDLARAWGFDVHHFRAILGPPHSQETLP